MEKITGNEPMTAVVIPAFIYGDGSSEPPSVKGGLTIRQHIAIEGMKAMITGITRFRTDPGMEEIIINRPNDVSEIACTYADAMIEALNKAG